MPWKIYVEDNKYCVRKIAPDGSIDEIVPGGCHNTREEALEHMRALYASETKEEKVMEDNNDSNLDALSVYYELLDLGIDLSCETCSDAIKEKTNDESLVEKAVWTTAYINDLPDSAFLYIEPGCGSKDETGRTKPRTCRHLPYKDANGEVDPAHLRNAIARANQLVLSDGKRISEDKAEQIRRRARSILERVNKSKAKKQEQFFMVWKDTSSNLYYWLASYSNNFRDEDNPPEIISQAAHKRFVEMVDNKEVEPPDLLIWHVPDWKIGEATWVAFDDGSGFAMAAGMFDKGLEKVAEVLASRPDGDLGVSHGMLAKSIKRDESDPSVITEYITREISVLPKESAANKLTSFFVLDNNDKESTMAIPEEKKKYLIENMGISEDVLEEIEKINQETSRKAIEEGLERKESKETVSVSDDENEQKEASEKHSVSDFSVEDIAEAVANVIVPIAKQVESIDEKLKELTDELAKLKASDEDRIKEKIITTPTASLSALLAQRVIGSKEATVEETDDLLKQKPKENVSKEKELPPELRTHIPFIDRMIASDVLGNK